MSEMAPCMCGHDPAQHADRDGSLTDCSACLCAEYVRSGILRDENGKPIVTRLPPPGESVEVSGLLAMSPAEKAAHLEFRDAAREARSTQEAAQKAAKRYAKAVRKLSEVCAPPATIEE